MDLDRVAALIGADYKIEYHEVLARRQEVRLRFNSPTSVEAWTVRVHVSSPDAQKLSGEIELFHWLADDEWELWHAAWEHGG